MNDRKEYLKRYRETHRLVIAAKRKRRYEANKEASAAYHATNRDLHNEQGRVRYQKNRLLILQDRKANPQRTWARQIWTMYRMRPADYDALLIAQQGRCGICNRHMRHPQIDHEPGTKRARGLLCLCCNTGLGKFQESEQILSQAINYLHRTRAVPSQRSSGSL